MRRPARAALLGALATLGVAAAALAHEERLVSGRVRQVDARARVLVVEDTAQERSVRITVDADTEVRRCRAETGLAGLQAGAKVRVKYLDRGGATFDILSVLVLPASQGR